MTKKGHHLFSLLLVLACLFQPSVSARSWFKPVTLTDKKLTIIIPNEYSHPAQGLAQEDNTDIDSVNEENLGSINWHEFFDDPYLIALIETALENNQEFNIFNQDIELARAEVQEKRSEYLPKVGLGMGGEQYRFSEHSHDGVLHKLVDESTFSSSTHQLGIGANFSWELDIWRKLRNAKDAARLRLMAEYEGRNYLISRLVSEIALCYYELMGLDNTLIILDKNIEIQEKAFLKTKTLKDYGKSNNLAVNRFKAQLLKTQAKRYEIQQNIIEKENRIRFLSGSYTEAPILRKSAALMSMPVNSLQLGVPAELLENRPDILQAEYAINAARLDVKSVKAELYPSVGIKANIGFSAFNPSLLFKPESLVYNAVGDILTPLINRQAIIARIKIADALQTQSVLNYEQMLLQAYVDVLNQLNKIDNLQKSYVTKSNEVQLLEHSVDIADNLFRYAKADYVEVLLTQEEKLSAEQELVELKTNMIASKVLLYRALGGGWR